MKRECHRLMCAKRKGDWECVVELKGRRTCEMGLLLLTMVPVRSGSVCGIGGRWVAYRPCGMFSSRRIGTGLTIVGD